ncbi:MAG: hypothetical protein MI725_08040 [Pirellulales bacterium]|nr:hypothetical protein [Pirellulales bacterium]
MKQWTLGREVGCVKELANGAFRYRCTHPTDFTLLTHQRRTFLTID